MQIKVKYLRNALPLEKIPPGDWIDLRTAEDVNMRIFEYKLIPLGICVQLPKGYEAHIVPRSSTFARYKVIQANHMGIIDESYCGNTDQWYFPAIALENTFIPRHTRICQFRVMKKMGVLKISTVKNLTNKNRGGFGSTGAQ